jgi:hypothetical protein
MVILFVNEASLASSPRVTISVNKCRFTAILDSGSEVNLLSVRVDDNLIETSVGIPILPVEVVLVTAFGRRSKRIRRQALVVFYRSRYV